MPAQAHSQSEVMAQKVLDNLYKYYGNRIISKPGIIFSNDKSTAAAYHKFDKEFKNRSNKIEIGQKCFSVCRKYGKDSSVALAWIMGHELSHAFQIDLKASKTNFLAYSNSDNTSELHEEMADVTGAFMAYLAGYNCVEIIEPLIDDIYKEFELNEKLSGYPSLDERKRTAAKVKKMIIELIETFEAGNMLLSMEEYELSNKCYEYVAKWYKGSEIYNNLGVNYSKLALNFTAKNSDQYIYPFELNWNTRMKKPIISRGELLSKEDIQLKNEYLRKADKNFVEANKINPELFSVKVNLFSLFVLRQQYHEALDFYKNNELNKKSILLYAEGGSKDQLRLAYALASKEVGEEDQSKRIWSEIANSGDNIYAQQASHNLKVINHRKIEMTNEDCYSFNEIDRIIDGVKLSKWNGNSDCMEMEEDHFMLCHKKLSKSTVFSMTTPYRRLTFQSVKGSWKISAKDFQKVKSTLLINGGSVYHCRSQKYVLRFDEKNRNIVEYIKYLN